MNNILKYLCFVLFGIIIYLLLRNRGKKERFSIGVQAACGTGCGPPFSEELNWSTCKNPECSPMIINFHDQGSCGTCAAYALASLLECMYNIKVSQESRTSELPPVSISPQSILDILGRYRHIYLSREQVYNNYMNMNSKDSEGYTYTPNNNSCRICPPTGTGECFTETGCGFHWWTIGDSIINLINIYNLKNLYQDQDIIERMDRSEHFHFPFPLLKLNPRRNDNDSEPYSEVTTICVKRYLFNETHDVIHDENYLYTEHFDQGSFVDFNMIQPYNGATSIFPEPEHKTDWWDDLDDITRESHEAGGIDPDDWDATQGINLNMFRDTVKEFLLFGPLLIGIEIDLSGDGWDHGLIDLNVERENLPDDQTNLGNHAFLLIGYTGDNVILLNSWPPRLAASWFGYEDTGLQHYITDEISFQVIYDNLVQDNNLFNNVHHVQLELPPPPPPVPCDETDCLNDSRASGNRPECSCECINGYTGNRCEIQPTENLELGIASGMIAAGLILGLGARCAASRRGHQPVRLEQENP